MALEQTPIRPIQVDYKCDECGNGYYRPTGNMLLCDPPKYPHRCNNEKCDGNKVFTERYPTVRYAREAELLDLDNYIPQTM
jgi:hypothetical protein